MKFIDNQQRLDSEQAALKEKNISYTIDDDLKAQGILRLYLEITKESLIAGIPDQFLPLKLTVSFPDAYPFFRPMIYAPEIELPRHQNVMDKNLCLLPRITAYWLPETLLADHLHEQLPKLFEQGMVVDPHALQENPDEQAEPVSEYYSTVPNASIIFDTTGFDQIQTAPSPIEFLGKVKIGVPAEAEFPCRLLVSESHDNDGNILNKLPDNVARIFTPKAFGSIYRLQERPPTGIAETDYTHVNELLSKHHHKGISHFKHPVAVKHPHSITNVIGLTFPEEHTPGQISWGWLFIVTGVEVHKNAKGKKNKKHLIYYSKINRIGSTELNFRIPQLKPLAEKTVAIFGLGALGAPSAIEFAKNGVKQIRLIDFDIINAGTTVRWPLGLSAAGMFKTDAVEKFINDNYPLVEIQKFRFRLGEVVGGGDVNLNSLPPPDYIDSILNDVSLIYDATAETGVTHFLAVEAQERKIPFVSIYGTKGVWGGAVMRQVPDVTEGCWMCFQYALQDQTIPMPPADDAASIQTAGCGDISFIGSSFELENISNAGVRLAVSTLCHDQDGYSAMSDDIGILSLVDENQALVFPTWANHKLHKHANCPYCNNQL